MSNDYGLLKRVALPTVQGFAGEAAALSGAGAAIGSDAAKVVDTLLKNAGASDPSKVPAIARAAAKVSDVATAAAPIVEAKADKVILGPSRGRGHSGTVIAPRYEMQNG